MYPRIRARAYACATGVVALGIALAPVLTGEAIADTLTLQEALGRARQAAPALSAASARTEAAQAGVDQAGRRPNPSLSLTGENLAATRSVFDRTETTLSYNQPFERGGKRAARISVAGAEVESARLHQSVLLLDLYQAVETAWVEALVADAQIGLASERLAMADRLRQDTTRRVTAARDPAFAGARVDTLATQAQIALGQARAAAEIARATLASYWRGAADFEIDGQALGLTTALPELPEQPLDVALLETQRRVSSARVTLEEARAVQDPTVQLGLRHFNNNNEVGVVAGVSIPLTFYDKNQGNIARARAEQRAVDQDILAAKATWERELTQIRARLESHATEARRLEAETIPSADKTLGLVRTAFDRGAFSYIEVIEAERSLADAKARRIEVLRLYHLDLARLNRLVGSYAETPVRENR